MLRRSLLTTATAFAVASCGANAATINAQVLADATGLVNEVKTIVAAIVQANPSAIAANVQANIASALTAATAALSSLSSSTIATTGASALQTVVTYLNAAMAAIQAALPAAATIYPALAPFVPMFDAAVALLPGIEAWIASVITPTKTSAFKLAPIVRQFTPTDARKWLGIPSV